MNKAKKILDRDCLKRICLEQRQALRWSDISAVVILFLIFSIHFWLQWNFNRQFIMSGILHTVVDPFNFLIQAGIPEAFSYRFFAINTYTGNPFMFLPFAYFLGYSPESFQIVFTAIRAGIYPVFFMVYREVLDTKEALLAVLVLSSMSPWVGYSWPDYDYMVLFSGIILFMYFRWKSLGANPRSIYTYLMSFLAGFFFYVKATVLYVVLGLCVSTLYYVRDDVYSFLQELDVSVLVALFILGATPFFVYISMHSGALAQDGFSFGGPQSLGTEDIAIERFNQLDYWLESDVRKLTTFPGIGSQTLEFSRYMGIHIFSAFLLLSLLTLIVTRSNLELVVLFFSIYILLFFLPTRSEISLHDVLVLVPLVPLIVIASFRTLGRKLGRPLFYRGLLVSLICLFSVSFYFNSIMLEPSYASQDPSLRDWGGSERFYEEFEQLEIDQPVLTNDYKVHIITRYFLEVQTSKFVIPKEFRYRVDEFSKLPEDGARLDVLALYQVERIGFKDMPLNYSKPVTLVIRKDLPCQPEESVCGASFNSSLNEFDVKASEMEKTRLDGEEYFVFRDLKLDFQRTSDSKIK